MLTRNHRTNRTSSHHSARAQGMVEFAMALPILLMLIFGIIEFGRLLFVYSAVISAAREASRYGAAGGDADPGTGILPYYQDCAGIRAAAKRIGSIAGISDGNIVIQYDTGPISADADTFTSIGSCPTTTPAVKLGDRISVSVTAHFTPLQGIVPIPGIDVNSTVRRTIIIDVDID